MNMFQSFMLIVALYAGFHVVVALGHMWIKYTFRLNSENIFYVIQKLKYGYRYDKDDMFWGTDWFICEVLSLSITLMIVDIVADGVGCTNPLVALSAAIVSIIMIFLPRYVVDILRSLKYNNKTGDSDRLLALEAEIEKLKGKNNEQ